MTIVTKFNVGDYVFFIHNNTIEKAPIKEIECNSKAINYIILLSTSKTSLDKNQYINKHENSCFATIDGLANYYKELYHGLRS